MARFDERRGVAGEGPVTEGVTQASEEFGSKGWLGRVVSVEVQVRGAKLGLDFQRGRAEGGDKKNGKIWYAMAAGSGYVVQTVWKQNAAKHHVFIDDGGVLAWCASPDVLAGWWLARAGRDMATERQVLVDAAAAVEAADPLPPLDGSPSQVSWAMEIRRALLVRCPHRRAAIVRRQEAKWWIDNKDTLARLP